MLKNSTLALVFSALLVMPHATMAQNGTKDKVPPTLTLRIKSFDALVENVTTIARAVGEEKIAKDFVDSIKTHTGPGGLDAVDTKKPFGLYLNLGEDLGSISGVVMVPIKDEKKFLTLLKKLEFPATKAKDSDIYEIEQNQVTAKVGFRFLNGYAYITAPSTDLLAKDSNLLTPAEIFAKGKDADISGAIRLDQIPAAYKNMALMQLEDQINKLKAMGNKAAKTPAQKKLYEEFATSSGKQIADFVKGATELTGELKINPKTKEIGIEMAVDSQKGTAFEKTIAALSKNGSIFGGLAKMDSDFLVQSHILLTDSVKTAVNAALEETIKSALTEEPASWKEFAPRIFDAFKPTAYSGDFDTFFSVRTHPNGQVTALGGIKVQQADKIKQAFSDAYKQLQDSEKARFKLDVAKLGATSIHQVDMKFSPEDQKVLGDGPIYFAITDQAAFVAAGKDGLEALKDLLSAPRVETETVARLEFKMGPLIALTAKTEQEKAAAKKAFASDPGLIRISVEGGQKLQIKLSAAISILDFVTSSLRKAQEVKFGAE